MPISLLTHRPLDLVIIMLGTNDLKSQYPADPAWIAEGMRTLVGQVKASDNAGQPPAGVLLVAPPPMHDDNQWAEGFINGAEKSRQLARLFSKVATEEKCFFFDAGSICQASKVDGLHLDLDSHQKLGEAAAKQVHSLAT